jgi:hypothetical protein
MGSSGGGPHTLACNDALGGRVRRTALVWRGAVGYATMDLSLLVIDHLLAA